MLIHHFLIDFQQGVLEAVRISLAGYPTRRIYSEFVNRFGLLALELMDGRWLINFLCNFLHVFSWIVFVRYLFFNWSFLRGFARKIFFGNWKRKLAVMELDGFT